MVIAAAVRYGWDDLTCQGVDLQARRCQLGHLRLLETCFRSWEVLLDTDTFADRTPVDDCSVLDRRGLIRPRWSL